MWRHSMGRRAAVVLAAIAGFLLLAGGAESLVNLVFDGDSAPSGQHPGKP